MTPDDEFRRYIVMVFLIWIVLVVSIMLVSRGYGAMIGFQWDSNTDNVTGYKVYCSGTGVLPFARYSTLHTQTSVNLTLPIETTDIYCAVTAYNASSESVYSNVVLVPKVAAYPKNFRRR